MAGFRKAKGIMGVLRSQFLILGSGVAGLKTALSAARFGTVTVITKKEDFESNTNYAQGGIASVLDTQSDSFESHIRDTLQAGAGLCHPDAVSLIVTRGPREIEDLIRLGVEFTRTEDGRLELAREGGHSRRRIVHAKDLTGREVERCLLHNARTHPNIQLIEHHFSVDLVLDENRRCWGAWVWDESRREMHLCLAGSTILATGGCGLVYLHSTNPPIATGDGVAMAFRAGARIANMEFIQFHPTSLYMPGGSHQTFLISEAVRGEGAILRTRDGTAFMEKYHPLKDLAPRDIVARAIDSEMKNRGDKCCYLDVTHINQDFFHRRFPNISSHCEKAGLNLAKDWIPIVPAAHYMCGGVITGLNGATAIEGLFCVGEAACTGVHGANRLASNSILEALVFSTLAAETAHQQGYPYQEPPRLPEIYPLKPHPGQLEAVRLVNCRQAIRSLMWDYVGIIRTNDRLQQARKRLGVLIEEIDSYFQAGHINEQLLELRNLAQTAELIILSALQRKESRGLHYNLDYPHLRGSLEDTVLQRQPDGSLHIESIPIPVANKDGGQAWTAGHAS